MRLASGDRVLVTGGAGFIGASVVRQLLQRDAAVVALVQPGTRPENLSGLDVEVAEADVRDVGGVERAVKGCRAVVHTAALYRFWAPDPRVFYEVNVEGTRNVLAAAAHAGTERVVYTSTVGTLGLDGVERGHAADETCFPDVSHLFGAYKRSKYVAEHEVLSAAAQGTPVTIVLPTFPVGPRDAAPTPSGRLIRDFLDGRMPGFVDTSLNVAHVDDVAAGHVLAMESGRIGRTYILGGENLTLHQLLAILAEQTGLPPPRLRVPRGIALAAAYLSDTVEGRLLRREPFVPLEATRMSTTQMAFDDRRARLELGYHSRPAAQALLDAAHWFVEHGYVRSGRRARIRWAPAR